MLADRFLPAFLITLEQFAERGYFTESAPDHCSDGHPCFWAPTMVRRALVGQMGAAEWPLDLEVRRLANDQVIEYVEAFYAIVSKPTESWFHSYCGADHPTTFDQTSGRYEYTISVNQLLARFGTGLVLRGGLIRGTGSLVLGPRLIDPLPFGGDEHLRTLVTMAFADFNSPDPRKKWSGLRSLADAYERVKSASVPDNKKQSVAALVVALHPDTRLAEHLDALLRGMTDLSNDLSIRHHEVGTPEITEDGDLVEFLFFSYYNVLRLALRRLYGDSGAPA